MSVENRVLYGYACDTIIGDFCLIPIQHHIDFSNIGPLPKTPTRTRRNKDMHTYFWVQNREPSIMRGIEGALF